MKSRLHVVLWLLILTAAACFLPNGDDIYPDDSDATPAGDDDDSTEEAA